MYIPASVSALLAVEILLVLGAFLVSAYLVLGVDPEIYFLHDGGLWSVAVVVLAIILSLYFQDMYSSVRSRNRTLLVQQICTAIGVALLLQSLVNYVDPNTIIPRWLMLVGSALSLLSLVAFRLFYSAMIGSTSGLDRILFLGRSDTVQRIVQRLRDHPEFGMAVLGYLDEETPDRPEPIAGDLSLGRLSQLSEVVARTRPERIVLGLAERRQRLPMYELLELKFTGVPIVPAGDLYENTHGRVSVADLRPSDLIFGHHGADMRTLAQFQSFYSWVLGLIGFILTLPLIGLVWVAVKITSPGPAFYSQIRSGLNGKPFRLYKFRSMRVDAEAATGAVWATKNDPRITPIGKWLRKLRLDELPQFVNVLRGEMNMVGPRPERPEFVRTLQEQIPFYRERLLVKPGLTGWAQINHKYGDTIEDTIVKLEYDLYYIKHRSVGLDLYTMFQTIKVMLLHRGAQ